MRRQPGGEVPLRASRRADRFGLGLFLLLVGALTALISWLKLGELFSWRYTSDLFTYDQIMQEILRGHWGLEFTYGNQFGDHCLLWLVWLAPVKLVLGKHMVVFLVLLGPLVYAVSAVVFFLALRRRAGALLVFCAATAYLATFMVVRGLHERVYGCHFDTLSGFLATMLAVLLVARRQALEAGGRARRATVGFWIVFALFLSLKEEMALLGIVFFVAACALRPSRFHLTGLAVAAAAFAGEMLLIHLCVSPWNRTNQALLSGFVAGVIKDGPAAVLTPQVAGVCATALVFVLLFAVLSVSAKKMDPYALALLAIGIAKLSLGLAVGDTDLTTWHNFPGVVMLTGAAMVQLAAAGCAGSGFRRWLTWGAAAGAAVAGIVLFVALELPLVGQARSEQAWMRTRILPPEAARERQRALAEVKARIDPRRITAIYGNTAVDWTEGFRYSFFPRGVFRSPQGIADYIVVDRALPEPNMAAYFDGAGVKEFSPVLKTRYVVLLQRRGIEPGAAAEREKFVRYFGACSIGGAE